MGGFSLIVLVDAGHSLLAWVLIFDRGKDRGVVLCFLYFAWKFAYVCVCVCVGVCVHIRTHTHALHVRYSDVSPAPGWYDPQVFLHCTKLQDRVDIPIPTHRNHQPYNLYLQASGPLSDHIAHR